MTAASELIQASLAFGDPLTRWNNRVSESSSHRCKESRRSVGYGDGGSLDERTGIVHCGSVGGAELVEIGAGRAVAGCLDGLSGGNRYSGRLAWHVQER